MKDLFHLLIFKRLYPETENSRVQNVFTSLMLWALVITVILFSIKGVISHQELNHVPPVKKPSRYHYDVITDNERAFFSTEEKMMLSEHGNIINMQGEIYFENAKSIRLIKIRTDEN